MGTELKDLYPSTDYHDLYLHHHLLLPAQNENTEISVFTYS